MRILSAAYILLLAMVLAPTMGIVAALFVLARGVDMAIDLLTEEECEN